MPAGNNADISYAVQTTKGTAAATALARTYLAAGGIGPERTVQDVEETSATRLRSNTFVSSARAAGSPAFWVRPDMIVPLLWGAMGTKATSGAGDPWTHTITLGATQPYMTFWRMLLGLLFERFIDCKVAGLNFSSGAGGLLRVEANIVGLTPQSKTTAETAATPEIVTPYTHMDGKGQFVVEAVVASLIGAARVNIQTGVTTAQGDAVSHDTANEGMFDITFETDQVVQDFATWNRYHYGSSSPADNAPPNPNVLEFTGATAIDFKWAQRTTAGAVATPERSLQLVATRVQVLSISGGEANTSGEPVNRTVVYRVVQPTGGASGLTAVVKNSKSAYATS